MFLSGVMMTSEYMHRGQNNYNIHDKKKEKQQQTHTHTHKRRKKSVYYSFENYSVELRVTVVVVIFPGRVMQKAYIRNARLQIGLCTVDLTLEFEQKGTNTACTTMCGTETGEQVRGKCRFREILFVTQ